ncbi:MAG: carboxylesterase family protein [Dehalococcoidia bacterium]
MTKWKGDLVVQTKYGAVKGSADENNTFVWKAIPFARPPVGDLRWRAPQEPEPWEGTRDATKFCSQCIQYMWVGGKVGDTPGGSEDCLYLNVWRPQTKETDLPVYVWIHGGGNSVGTATTEMYWGTSIANKEHVVYASMNYRLGPLGWFTHPALRTGNKLDDSGNYGTLDIIQSLKWIQANIKAFGGDPGNVTIAGESAGAFNAMSLLLSPLAEGLFHKAISESGMSPGVPVAAGEATVQNVLLKLLQKDGISTDEAAASKRLENMSSAKIATYLRSKPPEELYSCYDQSGFGMIKNPNIFTDGTVIVAEGGKAFGSGTYPNKVPLIMGTNKDEMKLFLAFTPEAVKMDAQTYQTITSYASDLWKANGVDGIARQISSHPNHPNVYAYQFLWGSLKNDGSTVVDKPLAAKIGACHGLETDFFLGNDGGFPKSLGLPLLTKQNKPGRLALSDAIMSYIAQFIRTGNPGTGKAGANLPGWEPWSNNEGGPKCILLDAGYDAIDIKMSPRELTEAGLRAEIGKLPKELTEAIKASCLHL